MYYYNVLSYNTIYYNIMCILYCNIVNSHITYYHDTAGCNMI